MRSIRRAFSVLPAVLALACLGGAARAQEAAAPAGDAARGAKLGYTCFGCHGIPDYRNAYPAYHVPKIGGQHYAYLVAALGEYRAGARPHPTMKGQAASLSEQDARDLAAYFATSTPVQASGKPVGTAPAAATTCVACHGPDGVGITPDYPTLAGQHADYIAQALRAYRKGTRQNAVMNGMAAALKDEDIDALAAYFSQQSPPLWVPKPPHGAKGP
ncbi:MAG: c-type cytochrome [Proteobacteria bacterium]|nr:c-type cytochrome [Pseudomonadota bacterium]